MASLGTEEKQENVVGSGAYSRQISRRMSRSMSRQSSVHSLSSLGESVIGDDDDNDEIGAVQLEATSKGKVKGSVAMTYYRAGASWFLIFVLLLSFVVVQLLTSFSDIWVSVW